MMKLQSNETEIVGQWMFDGARCQPDASCRRIEQLVANCLTKLSESRLYGSWETLFVDPVDGRLWERTYPQGELHGGGPPRLSLISEDAARLKYDF